MNIKMLKVLGTILSALVALSALYSWAESKGYNRAVTEISRESSDKIAEATTLAIKNAESEIASALQKQRIIFDTELASANHEVVVETKIVEVLRDVEKIKYVDSCGNLSSGSIILLNKAINQANDTPKN